MNQLRLGDRYETVLGGTNSMVQAANRRFTSCVDNFECPASLELRKIYQVLPDEDAARDGDLRVIDESGEDYLYPADYFVLIEVPSETARALNWSFARSVQPATCHLNEEVRHELRFADQRRSDL